LIKMVDNNTVSYCVTALRVHLSSETADVLREIGGFNMEFRGETKVKVSIYRV
jgi:hypothetical protein